MKFDWDAADYADYSSGQQRWARELLSRLDLTGSENLLDIGCGDGKVTAEIASFLKDGCVLGIDNSQEMVTLATARFPSYAYRNLSFRHQDARELSYCGEFDIVFSNAVLHWVIDHKPVLKGIYNALKPGGQAIVQMGGKGNATQVIEVVDEIRQAGDWPQYFEDFPFPYGFYSPEEYEPWLKDAGFDVLSLELKPKDLVHENRDEFMGWIRTTWLPYLQRVPEARQGDFIERVVGEFFRRYPPDQDGRIHVGMLRLEFLARK